MMMTREPHYNKVEWGADITSLFAQLLGACKLSLFWSEQHVSHRLSRSFSRGSCYANEGDQRTLAWLAHGLQDCAGFRGQTSDREKCMRRSLTPLRRAALVVGK